MAKLAQIIPRDISIGSFRGARALENICTTVLGHTSHFFFSIQHQSHPPFFVFIPYPVLCTSNSEPLLWRLAACFCGMYLLLQTIFSILLSSPPTQKKCSSFHTALQFWYVLAKSVLAVTAYRCSLPFAVFLNWVIRLVYIQLKACKDCCVSPSS